jgi:predicted dienelactone hydrolase
MMARRAGLLAVLVGCMAAGGIARAQSVGAVGVSEIRMEDRGGGRILDGFVWYPTTATAEPALIGDSAVFRGVRAVRDGDLPDGRFPLIILSHGLGGDRNALSWLAVQLAAHGRIVAAVNHPGTTRGHMPSPETRKPWERAKDITRAITDLLGSTRFGPRVNAARIAVIGHSLGGNTAMAVAGARFDVERFARDCDVYPRDLDCHWYLDNAIVREPSALTQTQQSLRDDRVGAVVALDVGFARGFTPESLAAVPIPILLIESGRQVAGRPPGWYVRYLAASLPPGTTTYREILDARHFSFVAECKPGSLDILRADGHGDEIVCMDGSDRDRAALHAEIAGLIEQFLRGAGFGLVPH